MKTINNFINEKLKITKNMINNQHNGYEFVDLDLPSGTLWAKCNIGADEEHEYGDYFAWGETETKKNYDWHTYKYCDGNFNELTKYCCHKAFGHDEFIDDITELEPSDDAAHVNMGGKWCIPTEKQWEELLSLKNVWVENYKNKKIDGMLLTAKNGNTLFLPAAGYADNTRFYNTNLYARYMANSIDATLSYSCNHFGFADDNPGYISQKSRYNGNPVRAVFTK
jgi:hypothetical protein